MLVTRRTAITLIGGTIIGLGSAGATGAFDRVEVERDVTISVDSDDSAYLRLVPHPSRVGDETGPDVGANEDGELYVDLSDSGINRYSTTDFDDLFIMMNNGTKDVSVTIDFLKAGAVVPDAVSAYKNADPTTEIGTIVPGDSVDVGMRIDTSDPTAADGIDTMQIVAESV